MTDERVGETDGRWRARGAWGVLIALGLVGVGGICVVIARTATPADQWKVIGGAVATFLAGVSVGLSEILSRYRDEPLRASTTAAGCTYCLLNGVISLGAFALLRRYPTQVFAPVKDDYLLTAIVAGFGAMVVFRSKLFTFRSSDGKEYAIGPAIVIETVLKTIDQKIDRRRATERQARVFAAMQGLQDFDSVANYIEASLLSFQNLTAEQKEEIAAVIIAYRGQTRWPSSLKSLALGFAFLNIAGEENFGQVVLNLGRFLKAQSGLPAGAAPATAPSTSP